MKLFAKVDPSRSWIKVPINLLDKLGITDKISRSSYRRGSHAYLDEDLDWTIFGRAMEENFLTYGIECEYSDQYSPIRQYQPFE